MPFLSFSFSPSLSLFLFLCLSLFLCLIIIIYGQIYLGLIENIIWFISNKHIRFSCNSGYTQGICCKYRATSFSITFSHIAHKNVICDNCLSVYKLKIDGPCPVYMYVEIREMV